MKRLHLTRKPGRGLASLTVASVIGLLCTLLGATLVHANSARPVGTTPKVTFSVKRSSARIFEHHRVDVTHPPVVKSGRATPASAAPPAHSHQTPLPDQYGMWQEQAANNPNAPRGDHSFPMPSEAAPASATGPNTPTQSAGWAGQQRTSITAPPDMALAASPSFVFQGVNTSFATYDTLGNLLPGWPQDAAQFLRLGPPANCNQGPNFSDPRAFYDPNDQRFWAAIIELEGADGILTNCPLHSVMWLAVSPAGTPQGSWNVYGFDLTQGTVNWGDFPQFGFDSQAVYFSVNMFDNPSSGNPHFQYAEVFEANKVQMEQDLTSFTAAFFTHFQLTSTVTIEMDTVAPVLTEAPIYGPRAQFFVSTFNYKGDPFGRIACTEALDCNGFEVWALSNPVAHDSGGSPPTMTSAFVGNTASYTLAPAADEPKCTQCIDPGLTNVTGTPVYRSGLISLAWATSVSNGKQDVPGIAWSQVTISLSNSDPNCTALNDNCADLISATQAAGGIFNFTGDGAAIYPAVMPDAGNNLYMVFDYMDSKTNPQVRFTARRATKQLNVFEDSGKVLHAATVTYNQSSCGKVTPTSSVCRWGDYSAASYDGVNSDFVWFAGEYAAALPITNDAWGTWIGKAQLTLSTP